MPMGKTHITFWNGYKMPIIGLGTWQSPKEEVKTAINAALEAGYRHIDCAYNYLNEDAIGEVIHEWIQSGKVQREELFIVTKLPMIGNRSEDVEKFLKKSLEALRLDYIDLYLIHCPVGMIGQHDLDVFPHDANGYVTLDLQTDLLKLWKGMEKQVDSGLVKSIGLSNFNEEQIRRIVNNARIKPANLQVELHAQFQQKPLRDFCDKHGITICAYAPLGSPGRKAAYTQYGIKANIPDLIEHPVVVKIANKHNKTTAQILLKYLTEFGIAVIPKSTNRERIQSNFKLFDFVLSAVEIAQLKELDQGESGYSFEFAFFFKGVEKHPENPYPNRVCRA